MSLEKIPMPKLGESVVEGTINTWLVKPGDHVNKYDPIAEVTTDKVNAEIPSSFTGVVKELTVEEGETVAVGELICYIETETASADEAPDKQQSPRQEKTETNVTGPAEHSMRKRYSPAVLRMAQEHQIDLEQVNGTGKGGRITRKDLEALIKDGIVPSSGAAQISEERTETAVQAEQTPSKTAVPISVKASDIEIPVRGVRKVIAEHMSRSLREIPHAWMMIEVDVTGLVRSRNKIKKRFKEQEGYNLTFFPFFIKAVAQALKEFPELNSTWGGDRIIQHKEIHLSFAVAKEDELFVPVIQNADELSIKGIARRMHELAEKARAGKLTTQDVEGGTFTVNNTGSFGSVQSMGIINHPQAAILQVESIVKRPVIIDDMFAARDMVNLCLSLDHRILDGVICGKFMARVKEILEGINEDNTNVF